MSSNNSPPPEAIGRAETESWKEGLFAGLTSGLASGVIGAKFMKLGRYQIIVSTVVTSALSGYYFTQAFKETNMKQLQAEFEKQQAEKLQHMKRAGQLSTGAT
ncbi:hypothetical protein BDZ89DRAFT_1113748 [Hymenopellis radicata]|nr:hypothetical protein BDZ89DRAFT_1113748 [Hymenopellis radicata]